MGNARVRSGHGRPRGEKFLRDEARTNPPRDTAFTRERKGEHRSGE